MKLIKTDHRTRLHRDTLSDIMEVKVEGPSLNAFSPKQAIETWWRDSKTSQKTNEGARKQFSPGNMGADEEESDSKDKMQCAVKLRVALQPTRTKPNSAAVFTIIKVLHRHNNYNSVMYTVFK